ALDTLIIDKEQLADIVRIIVNNDSYAREKVALTEPNKTNLATFMESLLDDEYTFVIRELVVPKPVQIGSNQYRCAGRCAFVASFDDETGNVELHHIASFWRPCKEPYRQGEPLTHTNLISSATAIPFTPLNKGFFRLTPDQLTQAQKEYSINTEI